MIHFRVLNALSMDNSLGPGFQVRPENPNALQNSLTLQVKPDHPTGNGYPQGQEHNRLAKTLFGKELNQLAEDIEDQEGDATVKECPGSQGNAEDNASQTQGQH
jgi:hypothetical protein